MRIKVTSDSTCDLTPELLAAHDITLTPLIVIKNDEEFYDGETISPAEIFEHVAAGGSLCSTAARSVGYYQDVFQKFASDYDGVIHISLGSGFSSSYQNACLAAEDFDNVRVVDSRTLTTAHGLIVLEAVRLAQTCTSLDALQQQVEAYADRVEVSFVLDRLDYMVKGGRCSSAAALGANLLNLKPCIEVRDGKLGVVKKYRGSFAKCMSAYLKDRLEGRTNLESRMVLVSSSPVSEEIRSLVLDSVAAHSTVRSVLQTRAGCTISCHCGPETIGLVCVRSE